MRLCLCVFSVCLQRCAGGWAESAVLGGSSHTHLQQVNNKRWLHNLDPHAACCQLIRDPHAVHGSVARSISRLETPVCCIFTSVVTDYVLLLSLVPSRSVTDSVQGYRSPHLCSSSPDQLSAELPLPTRHLRSPADHHRAYVPPSRRCHAAPPLTCHPPPALLSYERLSPWTLAISSSPTQLC